MTKNPTVIVRPATARGVRIVGTPAKIKTIKSGKSTIVMVTKAA